jgi:hypothetical protein
VPVTEGGRDFGLFDPGRVDEGRVRANLGFDMRIEHCQRNSHGSSEMSLWNSVSDQALAVLVRTEQRDELATLHSITSSARASEIGETSNPKVLAVFRLTTNSNLVPCWTGKSAGFAPLRILSTKLAERYHTSLRLTE